MLFATSFAVVGDLYSPLERGRIQGLFAAMFGVSSVLGPALGGWITDVSSWRWVFYINLPVGVVAFAVVLLGMPWTRPHGGRRPRLDLAGSLALTAALLPFLLALVWAGDRYAWRSWQIAALFAGALMALVAFVQAERRAAEPILPLQLFRNRTFVVSSFILLLTGAGMFGAITLLPLFLQGAQEIPAGRAGSLMTPLSLSMVAGSAVAGQAMTRSGRYKFLVIAGSALMVAGLLLLSQIDVDTAYASLVPRMVLVGVGLGCTMPVFAVVVQNALPYQLLGVATSAVQFFRSVGGTLGVAILTGIMLHRLRDGLQGTVADVPAVTGGLSQLLNARGTAEAERAYAQAAPADASPWSQLLDVIHTQQAEAIAGVFLIAAVVVAVTFVFAWLLPELELQRASPQELARRMAAAQPQAPLPQQRGEA
jgi:MFS family permease